MKKAPRGGLVGGWVALLPCLVEVWVVVDDPLGEVGVVASEVVDLALKGSGAVCLDDESDGEHGVAQGLDEVTHPAP
jgi:hypothetical protein